MFTLIPASAHGQQVAAGHTHTVFQRSDGTVWAVGENGNGQLGDNSTVDKKSPLQVAGLSNVVGVAAGGAHSMALTSGGTIYVWGDNVYGQLGDGSTTDRKTPVALALTNVVAVAAGEHHSMAVKQNGDVYTWGRNNYGQLGTGNTTNASTPVLVSSGGAFVAAGWSHALVVKADGSVWATGRNTYGALGDGTTTQRTSFVQMTGISAAVKAAGGRHHSLVLLSSGELRAVGYNEYGQLGDGTKIDRTTAVSVSNLSDAAVIAVGSDYSLAMSTDGSLRAWGHNGQGQLGDGTETNRSTPTLLSAVSAVTIAAGAAHSVSISSTGVVSTWGDNGSGELGDGTVIARAAPLSISAAGFDWNVGTPVFSVASGTYTTDRTVAVSVDTAGATIRYTLTGAEPTETDTTIASGSNITISQTTVLKAKAWKTSRPSSHTQSATYTMKVATPSVTPSGSTYTTAQTVTMSTATPGATLRYTTDGSAPTAESTAYAGAISVPTSTTLKIAGFKSNWSTSDLRTATYTMNFGTLAAPSMSPASGTYESAATLTLSSSQNGASIRYTTNGSAPTANSTLYTAPVDIGVSGTVRAKAFHPDYTTSPETSRTFTIAVAAPSFSPAAGSYAAGDAITLTTATTGAVITYSLDGSDPVANGPSAPSGGTLIAGNYLLKAKAWKTGATASSITTGAYAVTGSSTAAVVAAGYSHSLGVRHDGVAWAWGQNASGQVGDGTTTTPRLSPRITAGLAGASAAAGGTSFSLVLRADGTVWSFGSNTNGRLGDGSTSTRLYPTPVSGVTGATGVAAGDAHGLAVKADGTVAAWGRNSDGELGDGSTTQRLTAVTVSTLSTATAVAAGHGFSLARTSAGAVYAWGTNNVGQLGDGTTTGRVLPVATGVTDVAAIAAGHRHGVAVLSDGSVLAWGGNTYGQLADGTTTNRSTPVTVPNVSNVTAVAAGQGHTLLLKNDGTVWAAGLNTDGQLGIGSTTNRNVVVAVIGLTDIVRIAAGRNHSLAVSSDGTVWVWGENSHGQLGTGVTGDVHSPVAISGPGFEWRLAAPSITPASGVYGTAQTATVTCADPTVTLHYTTDGSTPTEASSTIACGGTLAVTQDMTVKAIAAKDEATSAVVTRTYGIQVATPSMTPGAGTYTSAQSVALSVATNGATIRYTLDGTDPTTSSSVYSTPLTVASATTLKARAFKPGFTTSAVGTAVYVFTYGTLATPTASPAGGSYSTAQQVTLSASSGAAIHYTLDGSTPTAASAVYTEPLDISTSMTMKAIAVQTDWSPSAVHTSTYDITADTTPPAISARVTPPANSAGWHNTDVIVEFTCSDAFGIVFCPEAVHVTAETAGQLVSGTAIDTTGLESSVQVIVKLDKSAPSLTITSSVPTEAPGSSLEVTADISADLSGISLASCNATETTVVDSAMACTFALKPGRNPLVLAAVDAAGNYGSVNALTTANGVGASLVVSPNVVTLVIGESRQFSARDSAGKLLSGVSVTSGDSDIVEVDASSLHATALDVGSTVLTFAAGGVTATVEVEVMLGPVLPAGTERWKVVSPSATTRTLAAKAHRATEDTPTLYVLELVEESEPAAHLRALDRDGRELWRASPPLRSFAVYEQVHSLLADSFGGVLLLGERVGMVGNPGCTIVRMGPDGGQAWRYESVVSCDVRQNDDGTVYVLETIGGDYYTAPQFVTAFNGETGQVKFRLPMPMVTVHWDPAGGAPVTTNNGAALSMVVGADGAAFVAVDRGEWTMPQAYPPQDGSGSGVLELHRIDSNGARSIETVMAYDWTTGVSPLLNSLTPDGEGGVLALWTKWSSLEETATHHGTYFSPAFSHTYQTNTIGSTTSFDQAWVAKVAGSGLVYGHAFGSEAITAMNMRSGATVFTAAVVGTPVMALGDGGVASYDEATGQLSVIDGSGLVEQAADVNLGKLVTSLSVGTWSGLSSDGLALVHAVAPEMHEAADSFQQRGTNGPPHLRRAVRSKDRAAVEALQYYNPGSVEFNGEYSGRVCSRTAGWYFTNESAFGAAFTDTVEPRDCPPQSGSVGRWHTHGENGQNQFSGPDYNNAKVEPTGPDFQRPPFYLAGPCGGSVLSLVEK